MVYKFNENIENPNIVRHYDYINDEGHYVWECDTFNIGYMDNDNIVTMYAVYADGDRFGSRHHKY